MLKQILQKLGVNWIDFLQDRTQNSDPTNLRAPYKWSDIRFSRGTHHSSVSFFRISTKPYTFFPFLLFPTITSHLLPHVKHSFWRI